VVANVVSLIAVSVDFSVSCIYGCFFPVRPYSLFA